MEFYFFWPVMRIEEDADNDTDYAESDEIFRTDLSGSPIINRSPLQSFPMFAQKFGPKIVLKVQLGMRPGRPIRGVCPNCRLTLLSLPS